MYNLLLNFLQDACNVYDDLFLDGSQRKAKLDYLKVPLLLNINVGPSKRVKLQLGPQYGGLLNQKVDSLKKTWNIFKKVIGLLLADFGYKFLL